MRALIPLLALCLRAVAAFYSEEGPVQLLHGAKEFDDLVLESERVCFVEFFAPWCPHCKNLVPAIEEVAKELKVLIPTYAVDCDEDENKKLCSEQFIEGFPTIKIFPAESKFNPYTRKYYKEAVKYGGKAAPKDMQKAAFRLLPDKHVTKLRSLEEWEAFREAQTLPVALLVSGKSTATPLLKGLALIFKDRLAFALAHANLQGMKAAVNATSSPALAIVRAGNAAELYDGKLEAEDLAAFLEQHAAPKPAKKKVTEPEEPQSRTASRKEKARRFTPRTLAFEEINSTLAESEDAWFIAMFGGSNETCGSEVAAWQAAVEQLGNLTQAATVFVQQRDFAAAAELGLAAPALGSEPCAAQVLLLPFGDKEEQDWLPYSGSVDAKELQRFALPTFHSDVTRLDGESLKHALGVHPAQPKLVLFTDKPTTPPLFAALAANFGRRGVDCFDVRGDEEEVLQQFGVRKVPSVVLAYLPPGTEWHSGEEQRLAIQPYQGPLKYPNLAAFVESVLEALSEEQGSRASEVDVTDVDNNEDLFQDKCKNTCIITVLEDNERRPDHLDALRSAVASGSHHGLQYLQVSYEKHPDLVAQLSLSASDVPVVCAYNGGKQRFAVLVGSFQQQNIEAFLRKLLEGKLETTQLQEPLVLAGRSSGVGAGGEAVEEQPVVEEEFDLSDILSESVDQTAKSKADLLADIDATLQDEVTKPTTDTSTKDKKKKRRKRSKKSGSSSKTEL